MKPTEIEASETGEPSPLERKVEAKARRQSSIIVAITLGSSLLLGAPSLEADAPSSMPAIKKETVVFKACSRKKNEKKKQEIEEYLRKKREEHQKQREKDLRKKGP